MPYIKSFCIILDGDRDESSLEDVTSESLRLERNLLKWLLFHMIL